MTSTPGHARVTLTPLGGAADPAIVEEPGIAGGGILGLRVHRTQSVGNKQAHLTLRNLGGRFNSRVSGSLCKIEARKPTGEWVVLLDGVLGEPEGDPLGSDENHPTRTFPVNGWDFVLDLIKVTTTKVYSNTSYRLILDDVISTYLAGYTRSLDATTTTPTRWEVVEGDTLRSVVDKIRRAHVAQSGGEKWEYDVDIVGGAKTFRYYQRSTTNQATLKPSDLRPGSRWFGGDFRDVVNEAIVLGATVPTQEVDKTGLSDASLGADEPTSNPDAAVRLLGGEVLVLQMDVDDDEQPGAGQTRDRSGQANHGTKNGGPSVVDGKFGKAISFDGVDDFVNVPDANSLDLTSAGTIMAWVKPQQGAGDSGGIVHKGTTNQEYSIQCIGHTGTTQAPRFIWGSNILDGSASIPIDTWHHIAATYDGATMRLYLDGALVNSKTGANLAANANALWVGKSDAASQFFKGTIEEARVLNVALSQADIQSIMNSPYNGKGRAVINAAGVRVAQPFTSDDDPLYKVRLKADRSRVQDPPTLEMVVARNSDNVDVLSGGVISRGKLKQPVPAVSTPTRKHSSTLNIEAAQDDDLATKATFDIPNDGVFYELAAWDLGASPTPISAIRLKANFAGTNGAVKVQSSTDDAAWTDRYDSAADTQNSLKNISDVTARYWRVVAKTESAAAEELHNIGLLSHQNLSADATNAKNVHDLDDATEATVASTGGTTKELARWDLRSAKKVAKVLMRHKVSATHGNTHLRLQDSADGSAWDDVLELVQTTSYAVDTVYLSRPATRYLRLVYKDDRDAASTSLTAYLATMEVFLHTDTYAAPLLGDAMLGSTLSWGAADLVSPPGLLVERSYTAPQHALIKDQKYWLMFRPSGTVNENKWWELRYGVETGAEPVRVSDDSGTTWLKLKTDAVLIHQRSFNRKQLKGTSTDAASQTKYAALVPGGKLEGSILDEGLTTQAMVDHEAKNLTTTRGDVRERATLALWGLRADIVEGKQVTLDREALQVLGANPGAGVGSRVFDVMEVEYVFGSDAHTVLQVGEHPPGDDYALSGLAVAATGGAVA